MKYTIYKITNKISGKIYIGKHQTIEPNDDYYGSGILIKNALNKYGKENFEKEVLFIFDTEEEMNLKEKELITEEFVLREDTYNLGVGGEGGPHFKGKKHGSYMKEINESEEHRDKIRKGWELRIKSGDHNVWNKGKKQTKEHNEKISKARKGKALSDDHKRKISNSIKGKKHSSETREKMRLAKLGKKK